ncbi:hypothetical protein FJZ26_01725 [Candidatus Parvarchaeota archaeon]|nr:hypothetical protein [Candidatus Parvarchaeota archaeon]
MPRIALAFLFLFIMAGGASAEFLLRSVSINIEAQKNGDAHITEEISLYLNSKDSVELYKSGIAINDLGSWKTRTGIEEVRYHVSSAYVGVENLRIKPQKVKKCSQDYGTCNAILIIDYVATPIFNKTGKVEGTGVFLVEQNKPRTIRYSINPKALSLKVNDERDIILDRQTTLTISIPKNSLVESVQPLPSALSEQNIKVPFNDINTLSWRDEILSKYELVFIREESLESEILQFFSNASRKVSGLIMGPEGLALIIILAIAGSSYVYLNLVGKKSRQEQ